MGRTVGAQEAAACADATGSREGRSLGLFAGPEPTADTAPVGREWLRGEGCVHTEYGVPEKSEDKDLFFLSSLPHCSLPSEFRSMLR